MTKLCVLMFRVTPGVFCMVPRMNRKITAFFLHTYLISCNVFGRRIIASAYIAWCGFCAHLIASFLDLASSIRESANQHDMNSCSALRTIYTYLFIYVRHLLLEQTPSCCRHRRRRCLLALPMFIFLVFVTTHV